MGHNCGTCIHDWNCDCIGVSRGNEHEYDKRPQSMHPCEHGEAIVASAVCDYEFINLPHGDVHAAHVHHSAVFHDAWLYEGNSDFIADSANFCMECGLRTATLDELATMYAAWQADQKGEGNANQA